MAKTDLIEARNRLQAEETVDETAVRVRTRIDLYINLPRTLSSVIKARPPKSAEPTATTDILTESIKRGFEAAKQTDNTAQKDLIGERALIPGLLALEMSWTRNPPAVADTFEIVLRGDAVPVDLRVFESIQIFGWLFVHEDHGQTLQSRMEQLKLGDPGNFGGIVDKVSRDDADGTFTLSCRDFTALPLAREATPSAIDGMDLDTPIDEIVGVLIENMPGGDQWIVSPRGDVGGGRTLEERLTEEQEFKVKNRKKRKKKKKETDVGKKSNASVPQENAATRKLVAALPQTAKVSISRDGTVSAGGVVIREASNDENRVKEAAKSASGSTAVIKKPRSYRPARYITKIVKPTPDRVFGTKKMTIWQAITKICQLVGVVAEVGISQSGRPMIVIVDQLELQQGTVFRRFERGRRRHRVITHGADIAQLVEGRDLVGAKRVNWVEVWSTDPVTGRTTRERYSDGEFTERRVSGRGRLRIKRKLADAGLTVFAPGVNSSEQLQRIAKRVWAQVNRGELEVTFSTLVPWTTGGGIFDADLLTCAPGALIEVQFARADRFKGLELEDVLKILGVPRKAARKLAEASQQLKPSLLFQVAEIQHSVGPDGEYTAALIVQTLLSDLHVPQGESLEDI